MIVGGVVLIVGILVFIFKDSFEKPQQVKKAVQQIQVVQAPPPPPPPQSRTAFSGIEPGAPHAPMTGEPDASLGGDGAARGAGSPRWSPRVPMALTPRAPEQRARACGARSAGVWRRGEGGGVASRAGRRGGEAEGKQKKINV